MKEMAPEYVRNPRVLYREKKSAEKYCMKSTSHVSTKFGGTFGKTTFMGSALSSGFILFRVSTSQP
jgi:hypothetical protein